MNSRAILQLPNRLQLFRETRAQVIALAALVLIGTFWFATRYPALLHKAEATGTSTVASMTYASEVISVSLDAALWKRILAGMVNWLAAMRVGMTFGVLFGALLHLTLRYYPLKLGTSLSLNSVKGALVGMPMGVCANCAVPTACGVTRGNGRLEVALGFLFSSPNFNPVVVMMTITYLPMEMVLAKYGVLLALIVVGVPALVRFFQEDAPDAQTGEGVELPVDAGSCDLPLALPREPLSNVLRELAGHYLRNCWMLLKPTVTIMLVASFLAATTLALVPLESLLASSSPSQMGIVSVIATLMPVPIALDVMFAAQLQAGGAAPGYVMLFLMTLGTFSIVPAIYLWRDVSKGLSVALLVLFIVVGFCLGMAF